MTADERIEKLLNRFGQTISDLPKPDERKKRYTYGWYTKLNLDKAARKWEGIDSYFSWDVVGDYACHLCDIIDRLEIALETAVRCTDCGTCEFERTGECSGIIECNYRICDGCLMDSDVTEELKDLRIQDE